MTAGAVSATATDTGVARDGDFQRCFLFGHLTTSDRDEYIVVLRAVAILTGEIGSIIHDTRTVHSSLA